MSITYYTDLKTSVADWLNRDDVSDTRIAEFIQFAENRIFKELRIKEMETSATLTIDSQGKAAFPADCLEPKEVIWADEALGRISLSNFYSRAMSQGKPIYFTREGNNIKFWPIPTEGSTDCKLIYYARPTNLSDVQLTNTIFALAPEMYLFAALISAGTYLGSPQEKLALWADSYRQAFDALVKQSRQADVSGATMLIESGY